MQKLIFLGVFFHTVCTLLQRFFVFLDTNFAFYSGPKSQRLFYGTNALLQVMRFEAGFFHLVFFGYLLCVVIMGGCRGDSKNVLFAMTSKPSFALEGVEYI